ncbi:MAG: hypothetical protein F6K19_04235 [Cyanothece sp. SIO1E1]|nr:hypothetical protein [Cyanothece sp. SIO1E1]
MMKLNRNWSVIPTALGLVLAAAVSTHGQGVVSTPLQSPVQTGGQSSGPKSTSCGYIANRPNHVLQVTQPFTSLRFQLKSTGSPTLFIQGPGNRNQCILADNLSGGNIEVPGMWEQGTYSIFIGDRNGNAHGYNLTITQE